MKKIVAFHIGRGGHFNNQGHKSYNRFISDFQELIRYKSNYLFLNNEDEKGEILPEEDWTMTDGSGKIMLQGREEIESDTGKLEWDCEYDTDIVKYIEDCNDEEIRLLVEAYGKGEIGKDYLPEIVSMWDNTFDLEAENGEYYIDICYNKKKVFASAFDEPCVLKLGNVVIWDSSNNSMEDLETLFSLY